MIILGVIFITSGLFAGAKAVSKDKVPVKASMKPLITFVELGSVNCIPCKQMQPVMKEIEEKYKGKVEVIFYDVWKKENKDKATFYKIKLIPTQVFLDANGKEFFRHEGFYPAKEISKIIDGKIISTVK
jgi:thioredoxin 1